MNPEGDDNPYAPPQTPPKGVDKPPRFARPASTVLVAVGSSCWCVLLGFLSFTKIAEEGFSPWLASLMTKPIALLMPLQAVVSAGVTIIARRNLFAYFIGSLTSLLWLLLLVILMLPMYPLKSISDIVSWLGFCTLVISPFYLLFYRFTFSLPSRRYYCIGSQVQDAP